MEICNPEHMEHMEHMDPKTSCFTKKLLPWQAKCQLKDWARIENHDVKKQEQINGLM